MRPFDLTLLSRSCELLFDGSIGDVERFVFTLSEERVRSAFRDRVKNCHPDKAKELGIPEPALEERFKQVVNAYQDLTEFLENRNGEMGTGFETGTVPAEREARVQHCFFKPSMARDAGPAPSRPEKPTRMPGQLFYSGALPRTRLRFGRFLYYKGLVSWQDLLAAVEWQNRERPSMGQIALELRYLSSKDLSEILYYRRFGEPFGQVARWMRKLSSRQVKVILKEQARYRSTRIGQFFVRQNVLTNESMEMLLHELNVHNDRFGFRCMERVL